MQSSGLANTATPDLTWPPSPRNEQQKMDCHPNARAALECEASCPGRVPISCASITLAVEAFSLISIVVQDVKSVQDVPAFPWRTSPEGPYPHCESTGAAVVPAARADATGALGPVLGFLAACSSWFGS